MEQKQITLDQVYKILLELRARVEDIDEKLNWEHEFTEEENKEFARRTEEAWREIDDSKGETISVGEFLDEIDSLKKNA